MPLDRDQLTAPILIPASVGSIYANPAGKRSLIKGFVFHNTDTASQTFKVHVVPGSSGALGSAAVSNQILSDTLPAEDTLIIELPYPCFLVNTNDSVQAVAGAANKITVMVLKDTENI